MPPGGVLPVAFWMASLLFWWWSSNSTETQVGRTNDGSLLEANPSLVYPVPLSTTTGGWSATRIILSLSQQQQQHKGMMRVFFVW